VASVRVERLARRVPCFREYLENTHPFGGLSDGIWRLLDPLFSNRLIAVFLQVFRTHVCKTL
jgi:hypothetical protein